MELRTRLGRPANSPELGIELGLSEDKLRALLGYRMEPMSLSEPLREGGDVELGDTVEDLSAESPVERAALALLPREIERLLGPLDEREREVLRLRSGLDRGEPRTLRGVAEHFDASREQIRKIEARAIAKLRHPRMSTARAT